MPPGGSPWRKQRLRADSLDSSSEEDGEEARNDSMCSSDEEDERPASTLDLQLNVCNLPAIGLALKIDTCLVKWEGLPDTQGNQPCGEPLEFRVLLEAGLGEMTTSHLQLENCGTTAIYYTWQHIPRANPHGAVRGNTQRFYFDTRGGVLLPGQCFPFPFIFKSPNPGVFSETWALQTGPVLAKGKPLVFVLRGVAFQEDLHVEKRSAIEDMLTRGMASDAAAAVVKRLVDSVCTPPHTPEAVLTFEMEEDAFVLQNPGLFYHHHLLQRLKSMYGAIVSPPPPEGEVPPGKADPKVPPKGPKEKKEAEAKKGKQPAVLEEPSSAGIPELQEAHAHTGWGLSISSLQEAILHIEDDVVREEKLKELNMAVGSLTFPPPEHPKSVPSSPGEDLSSKKDKKGTKEVKKAADAKQKGKEKEKMQVTSSSGKAKAVAPRKSKGSMKDADKPEGEVEDTITPAEVDPILVNKYKDALHRALQVYEILGSSVDKMTLLFEDL